MLLEAFGQAATATVTLERLLFYSCLLLAIDFAKGVRAKDHAVAFTIIDTNG